MPNSADGRDTHTAYRGAPAARDRSSSSDKVINVNMLDRSFRLYAVVEIILIIFFASVIFFGNREIEGGNLLLIYGVFIAAIAALIGSVQSIRNIRKRNQIGFEISISKDGLMFHKKNLFLNWQEIDSIRTFSTPGVHQIQLMIREDCRARLRNFEPRAEGGTISIGPEAIVVSTKSLDISKNALYEVIRRFSKKKIH